MTLRKKQAIWMGSNFNSKKISERKILDREALSKKCNEFLHNVIIVTYNNNVININKKINHDTTVVKDKKTRNLHES